MRTGCAPDTATCTAFPREHATPPWGVALVPGRIIDPRVVEPGTEPRTMGASLTRVENTGADVTNYGITGHTNLSAASVPLVDAVIRDFLGGVAPGELLGYSCLAAGADAIFARAVLDLGGRLVVLLPAADYGEAKVAQAYRADFDALLTAADEVRVLPYAHASRDAYAAANEA